MSEPTEKSSVFSGVHVACCMGDEDCVCGSEERVLRGYIRNDAHLHPMTAEQRKWCLAEIGSVEGYERSQYATHSDSDLASTVLRAWTDYCRDKGLL